MAAKGAAFGIRHLLEKVDENFTWAKPRGRVRCRKRRGKPSLGLPAALFQPDEQYRDIRRADPADPGGLANVGRMQPV